MLDDNPKMTPEQLILNVTNRGAENVKLVGNVVEGRFKNCRKRFKVTGVSLDHVYACFLTLANIHEPREVRTYRGRGQVICKD